jgi:hypothetical protein
MRRVAEIFGWMVAASCVACDPEDAFVEAAPAGPREAQANGWMLNGWMLNGWMLNGWMLNSGVLSNPNNQADNIQIVDMKLGNYAPTTEVWIEDSRLVMANAQAVEFADAALVGATIQYNVAESGNAKKKYVKITSAAPVQVGSDVWAYDMDVRVGNKGAWAPLCIDGNGQRVKVLVLGDVWDPATGARLDQFTGAATFACRGGALAKCVEMGYRPWASATLHAYHQACARMIRADYCGDGVSHTVTGTTIHVLDAIGVQNADPNVSYAVEAEWGPNGAVCLNPANTRLPNQTIGCSRPACGAAFASGGLIQSGKVLAGP